MGTGCDGEELQLAPLPRGNKKKKKTCGEKTFMANGRKRAVPATNEE